jgi:phosphomannomutase
LTLPALRFGTDGWRGVIAKDATFETYRRLARAAAARYLAGDFGPGDRARIVVGHDPRFLAEEFSGEVAAELARAGITVLLTSRPIPTPAVSLAVRRLGLSGGIAITASHNPAPYNGFKLKNSLGASASPELYARIEREVDRPLPAAPTSGAVERADLWSPYLEALGRAVDLSSIRAAGFSVLADAMHGAAADALETIVSGGATRVESFRANRDVLFGGGHPEPIGPNLDAAGKRIREGAFDLGVATDGDADRLGVLDRAGVFVSPHRILGLLLLHAFRVRGVHGGIAKTFSTSLLIDRIAAGLGAPLFETGIGFKYIADRMAAGEVAAGGEESGGYGFAFHLPERDGTLSALLLLEYLARTGRSLDRALSDLAGEFGSFAYERRDVHLPLRVVDAFLRRVSRRPPSRVAGERVTGVASLDGVKLLFGGRGWLLMRRSGTEPMIRLYCEHDDAETCRRILGHADRRLAQFAGREAA